MPIHQQGPARLELAQRAQLLDGGVEASEVQDFPWGRFVFFADPDGNRWAVQQIVRPG
jgi:predicted enzyme related to lactoylglutathione lyase